ncbi:hypothetical protein [Candidimonas nitroreducens]|uniref:YqjK-like protein n=1 Tax=Candidimonas nitroreducens TaxID=683354 RepID=A0A225MKJ1_9BURK|nr:hypothetical protein [Candidimonas nitroreducens]OWT61846.1 hypothetical protein CEY11_08410 [Candidimonas nitroreducens]
MSDRNTRSRQELRIEVLRARAALERQALRRSVAQAGTELRPAALLQAALPRLLPRSGRGWLADGLSLARRYPLLVSLASALLTGRRRGRTWLRLGAGLLLGLQAWRMRDQGGRR